MRVTISNEIITPSQCGQPPPATQCQEIVRGRLQCDVNVIRIGPAVQDPDAPIYVTAFSTIQMQYAHPDVWLEWLGAPRYGTLYAVGDQVNFHLDVPLGARIPLTYRFEFAPDFMIWCWNPVILSDGATYPSGLNVTAWVADPCS